MTLPELLQTSPPFFISLCALLGLMVGSFLNVVIHRLPRMLEREWHAQCTALKGDEIDAAASFNLFTPRSRCPGCGHPIHVRENIPIVSYLMLRGRCAHCGAAIGRRYPLVEAMAGIAGGVIAWHFGFGMATVGALLFTWTLLALTFIDLDTQLLPDYLTQPLLWLGLVFNLGGVFAPLASAVIGAVAGYVALWAVYWLFKLATGKEGMGYGDFKLLAAIGAWLGWQLLPLVILLSSLVGAVVGLSLMLFARHGRHVPIPFGPYLAGGGLIALFWGRQLVDSYLSMV